MKSLQKELQNSFNICKATDGLQALEILKNEVIHLVISDIMMPVMDGIELCRKIKTDIEYSHIPVILLTAKNSIEQQIEGMKNWADAYVAKPFNTQFLDQTIKSLLANRARLKEHFTGEMPVALNTQIISKPDRKFISEFKALVESNLSNEDFNIDSICKSMGVSRVQLYKKVKALLNMNVNDYILSTRLQKAKYLLKNESFTIGEIASRTGFTSPAYFSTVFKSKEGITPKEFREK